MNNSTSQVKVLSTFDYLILLQKSSPHLRNYLYSLVVFNFISAIVAVVLNFLIILTFVKTSSLRTPSYILILSLAFSDLGVGVVTQPAFSCRLIALLTNNSSMYENSINVSLLTGFFLVSGSLITVTAITIDRFLAVHLILRYQQLVTTKRSYTVVILIWVASLSWSFVLATKKPWVFIVYGVLGLAIIILDISLMLKISRAISRHSAQMQAQQQPQQPTMNMHRYRKSVKTMYYIMGVFLVCYLLNFIFAIVYYGLKAAGINTRIKLLYARYLSYAILMLNSALNPLIYCWRIEEIRNTLLQLLKRQ